MRSARRVVGAFGAAVALFLLHAYTNQPYKIALKRLPPPSAASTVRLPQPSAAPHRSPPPREPTLQIAPSVGHAGDNNTLVFAMRVHTSAQCTAMGGVMGANGRSCKLPCSMLRHLESRLEPTPLPLRPPLQFRERATGLGFAGNQTLSERALQLRQWCTNDAASPPIYCGFSAPSVRHMLHASCARPPMGMHPSACGMANISSCALASACRRALTLSVQSPLMPRATATSSS